MRYISLTPASAAATRMYGSMPGLPPVAGGVTMTISGTPATWAGMTFISTDDGYAALPPGT